MQQQLLPTGRVAYFPMSEYLGGGRFRTLAGTEYAVIVKQRVVDATYLRAIVPSMRPAPCALRPAPCALRPAPCALRPAPCALRPAPCALRPAPFSVAPGIDCIAPNELPKFTTRERYVIVGAGKTGMDACLWLLRHDVSPEKLTWIMPRDSWLIDRATLQPGPTFIDQFRARFAGTLVAILNATSTEDLFERLECAGTLLRLDPSIRPTMYRYATVSRAELDQLRRVDDVVRMGRVQSVEPTAIVLDDGSIPSTPAALYIDCTADGLQQRPAKPVFDADCITLQSVRGCQQVFSAAFIAHVEAAYDGGAVKNELCLPVPHPNSDLDWLRVTDGDLRNQRRWLDDADLMDWLSSARLNLLADLVPPLPENERQQMVAGLHAGLNTAREKLEKLISPAAVGAARG
jgi:hypothetical protein